MPQYMSSMISLAHSGLYSASNSSTLAHHTSKHHKSGKYKTKTKTVTEDCDDDDDESITTSVEVSSTPVTITAPGTVTKTVIRIDFESTKSLHKPKHTKHHLTETEVETETETIESTSPTVTESSETHTKHHKSKHHKSKTHKSKHHKSKHSSSETVVETPVPTSVVSSSQSLSQSASDTSKEEVVVVTTEEVEVITTGVEEIVSTITVSEGDTRLSTLTKATPTESSTEILPPFVPVTLPPPEPSTTSDYTKIWVPDTESYSHPWLTSTFSLFPPTLPETPFTSDWWEAYTHTETPAEETTTATRSGHKTKEPPFIFHKTPRSSELYSEIYPLSSISSEEIPPPWTTTSEFFQPSFPPNLKTSMGDPASTITTAPEFYSAETWSADSLVGILNARDSAGGDPRKKHDKMLKPDHAMSKRMSRWSKHHSHLLEKSWSQHTKAQVKSLQEQMRYDAHQSRKHHTTLAAVLPAMASEADANALEARDVEADAAHTNDPEKDYQRQMSVANKVYNKFSSFVEQRYEKNQSKEDKKASKKRAKSIAKQNKKEEKSRKKAIKSRIKHQKGDDDDEDVVVWADVAGVEMVSTTPKTGVPAMATKTATVTTIVGGSAGNGTLSTSWRVHAASQTASVSTAGW